MLSALQNLFATIMFHCNPTDIKKLWNTCYKYVCGLQQAIWKLTQYYATMYLNNINNYLGSMGKSIYIYYLSQLDHNLLEIGLSEYREINESNVRANTYKNFDALSQLNPKQEHALTKQWKQSILKQLKYSLWMAMGKLKEHTYNVHYLSILDQEIW